VNWDLLLEWTSECGAGTWADLRDVCTWLGSRGGDDRSAWSAAHRLACLGHLELDWDSQHWSAAPPVLTMLPRGGGFAISAGARTRTLRAVLQETVSGRDGLWLTTVQQPDAPEALFLQCADEGEVAQLAADLGIVFDPLAADRLSRLLPDLAPVVRSYPDGPPNRGFETKRFDATAEHPGWIPIAGIAAPGLYRVEVYWRVETWWSPIAGRYGPVHRAEGVYLELRRCERSVLRWEPDARSGTLIVPWFAPLPVLHARAAFLCSGLAPSSGAGEVRYVNVPQGVARQIAGSLGQAIRVSDPPQAPPERAGRLQPISRGHA
jgi:hypothetical protein